MEFFPIYRFESLFYEIEISPLKYELNIRDRVLKQVYDRGIYLLVTGKWKSSSTIVCFAFDVGSSSEFAIIHRKDNDEECFNYLRQRDVFSHEELMEILFSEFDQNYNLQIELVNENTDVEVNLACGKLDNWTESPKDLFGLFPKYSLQDLLWKPL